MKELFLLITVTILIGVGVWITLRSGGVGLRSGRGLRMLARNVTGLLLRVTGYLVALFVVQRAVGLPSPLRW